MRVSAAVDWSASEMDSNHTGSKHPVRGPFGDAEVAEKRNMSIRAQDLCVSAEDRPCEVSCLYSVMSRRKAVALRAPFISVG